MSSEIKVDTISENTSANGVAIDSVTLKDGGITTTGAVGVNESSPSSYYYNDLVVNSGDEGGITIVDTSGGQSSLAFADGTSGSARYSGRILYDHSTDKMRIGAGGNTYLNIDGNGHVTNAYQPAFLVKPTNNQTDFNQGQTITIVLDNEIYDQNGDFASNTFTAPVTGKYCFQFSIQLNDISNQDSSTYYYIELNTSNRAYYVLSSIDQAVGSSSGQYFFTLAGGALADMDANDTMTLRVVHGGTSGSGPSDVSNNSHLSGFLAC